jgi:hypothetical protein
MMRQSNGRRVAVGVVTVVPGVSGGEVVVVVGDGASELDDITDAGIL